MAGLNNAGQIFFKPSEQSAFYAPPVVDLKTAEAIGLTISCVLPEAQASAAPVRRAFLPARIRALARSGAIS
jgi:hypothetical protein